MEIQSAAWADKDVPEEGEECFRGQLTKEVKGWVGKRQGGMVVGKWRSLPWCDSAHLSRPDRRNHPHCQSEGKSAQGETEI